VTFILIGYFPKRIVPRPNEIDVPSVREIWSVSNCISRGPPDGWIDQWVHDRLGLFSDPATGRSVTPSADNSSYVVVAYRMWDEEFVEGTRQSSPMDDLSVAPPLNFVSLGFDAVGFSTEAFFEHSPLSCNYAARTMPVNEFCLFPDLEAALRGAEEFSNGSWEPGRYRVVEVLREAPV
jgi:hypothetical protein